MQGEIRHRLEEFISKYYKNLLVRGIISFAGLWTGVFLFLNLSEYYLHFTVGIRTALFFGFLLLNAGVLWFWVMTPLMKLKRLGKVMTYEQASRLIGAHFPEVKDKLLNLLQLEHMQQQGEESALLLAGIAQKTKELKVVPFAGAIDVSKNKKVLRWAVIPVLMLGLVLLFQSSIITDGTQRLLQYDKHFPKPAPFEFKLISKTEGLVKGQSYKVMLKTEGKIIPEEVWMHFGKQNIKLTSDQKGNFYYELEQLGKDEVLWFESEGYSSDEYLLKVEPNPRIAGFKLKVEYPAYLGKQMEWIETGGDLALPEGSRLEWTFSTQDADGLEAKENGKWLNILQPKSGSSWKWNKILGASTRWVWRTKNGNRKSVDSIVQNIEAIPDRNPVIGAEKFDDSLYNKRFYFVGQASDDHGITGVYFVYRLLGKGVKSVLRLPVGFVPGKSTDFTYAVDLTQLGLAPGDEIEYAFETRDNDGVHGAKSAFTTWKTLRRMSIEEVREEAEKQSNKIGSSMQQMQKQALSMQKQTKELSNKLNQKRNLDWQLKDQVKDLLKQQEEFRKQMDQLKEEQQRNELNKQEFMQPSPEMLERQKKLEELFKLLEDPEVKKMLEELKKLLEQQGDKDQVKKNLDQLGEKNKEVEKELQKLQEQWKQMELEQKLEDGVKRLEELASKQEKESEELKNGKQDLQQAIKDQAELQKELKEIREELNEAKELNEEMEDPMDLEFGEQEGDQAEQEMQEAGKEMQKGDKKDASQKQKNAAEKMKEMAEKMSQSLKKAKEEQVEEDYKKVRELLESLIELSFEQEDVMTELGQLREYNPRFIALSQKQVKLKDDSKMLEDSLLALAKRQPLISTYVNQEVAKIRKHMEESMDKLKERRNGDARVSQQYAMTSINNLAVMLMESMENMQQQMGKQNQQSKGNKSCNNPNSPGKGKKPKKGLSQSQKELGEQLQKLQQGQKQGQGQKKPGGENGQQGEGKEGKAGEEDKEMKRELAKAAMMQEALRRQLQQMKEQLEKEGMGQQAKELKKTMEMMEQQEKDWLNGKLNPESIRRQKEIETRLLEHEKAEREQEQDDQRTSKQPSSIPPEVPQELRLIIEKKRKEQELLKRMPPELTPFYREKVEEFFRGIPGS